jgi:hypothetical protein
MTNNSFIRRYQQRLSDPEVRRARRAKLNRQIEQGRQRNPRVRSAAIAVALRDLADEVEIVWRDLPR